MPSARRVMILCPVRGVPAFTGDAMSADVYETAVLIDNVIGICRVCGLSHKWSKKDAFLEGDEPQSISSELDGDQSLTRSGSHP